MFHLQIFNKIPPDLYTILLAFNIKNTILTLHLESSILYLFKIILNTETLLINIRYESYDE